MLDLNPRIGDRAALGVTHRTGDRGLFVLRDGSRSEATDEKDETAQHGIERLSIPGYRRQTTN